MPYIGVSPSNGVRRVHTYTATASQTTFTGAGAEGTTLSYKDSNFVDVYQNGVKLGDGDYTATSGTSIVLGTGASASDLVVIVVFDVFSVADTVSKADGGTFDGNVTMGGTLGVTGALSAKGGAVFNEDSADVDFRVESNNNANMLVVDGGLDAVGIGGGVSTNYQLKVAKSDGSVQQLLSAATNFNSTIAFGDPDSNTPGEIIYAHNGDSMRFHTNGSERMRIHSSGFLRASPNSTVTNSRLSATTAHVFHSHTDGSIMFFVENTQADPYGMMFDFSQASPDDNTNFFMKFEDGSAERAFIYSDGDMYNHDGTFAQISDERIKDNITDANSQWADIKAMRFVNYQRKDDIRQYGKDKAKVQLGLLSQELEKVSPNLVRDVEPNAGDIISSSEFGTLYEDGDTIPEGSQIGDVKEVKDKVKGVAYSILYMKAVKALQEAMTRIETLEAEVKALKGE